jgi:hypothetical protein
MKIKMLVLAGLFVVSSIASAQSVTVGYSIRDLATGQQEHQNSMSIKTKSFGSLTGDVGVSAVQNDSTYAVTNRYEIGVTHNQPLFGGLSGDFRVAQGWKAKSGSDTTTYYVLEPSVTSKITGTPVSVKVGYRVRNAWDSNVADNSKTSRLSVGYDLTSKDRVSFGRDWQRGDGALIQTTLQYTRSF